MKSFIYILSSIFLLASCGESVATDRDNSSFIARDTTITPENSFTLLSLDSSKIEEFIVKHKIEEETAKKIRSFYNGRNFQYAWFTEDGLAEQAQSFWNLHNQYIIVSRDSSLYDKKIHQQFASILNEEIVPDDATIVDVELELTHHFLDFTKYAYDGKLNPEELQWNIPRKKIDAVALLDSLVSTKGSNVENWEPVNEEFKQLQKEALRFNEIEKKGEWVKIDLGDKKVLKIRDSSAAVVEIKKRLNLLGDYSSSDISPRYTSEFEDAVKRYQKRHGLADDGVVGPAFLGEINTPVQKRIEQILINLERMRWMPVESKGKRVVVNIPEFKLHVYEDKNEVMNMNIVVGKAGTRTVIFSDQIKYVVFSPYWNVPQSIVRNEIVPAMNRNSNYLAKNNMEITGNSNGLPVIRQKPGGDNSLGRVKFLFPNSYNIYLHDTPAKSLFERDERAFSHGCIRIQRPADFAAYLLKDYSQWTESRIQEEMYRDTEKWVTLKETVPVFISYFTAWVDNKGVLNFREDIYDHDKKMANRLFEN